MSPLRDFISRCKAASSCWSRRCDGCRDTDSDRGSAPARTGAARRTPRPNRASWGSIDPPPQLLAVGLGEGRSSGACLLLHGDDAPADQLEHLADAAGTAGRVDHAVELGDCSRSPTRGSGRRASSLRAGPSNMLPCRSLAFADQRHHAAGRPLSSPSAFSAAHTRPAPARRTAHGKGRRWARTRAGRENRRCVERPVRATMGSARPRLRKRSELAARLRPNTGTGWRGIPARHAASPRMAIPGRGTGRSKAPSSPWRKRGAFDAPAAADLEPVSGWARCDWRDGMVQALLHSILRLPELAQDGTAGAASFQRLRTGRSWLRCSRHARRGEGPASRPDGRAGRVTPSGNWQICAMK